MRGYVSVGEGAGGWRRRVPSSERTMHSMVVTQSLQIAASGRLVLLTRRTLSVLVWPQNAHVGVWSGLPACSDVLVIVCSAFPVRTPVDRGTVAAPWSGSRPNGGRRAPGWTSPCGASATCLAPRGGYSCTTPLATCRSSH